MLVATLLFSIIAVMAIGSFMSILDTTRKVRTQQAILGDIHLAVEKMTREIRDGGTIQQPSTLSPISNTVLFENSDDALVTYRLQNGQIQRCTGTCVSVTAPNLTIDNLTFTMLSPSEQPGLAVVVQGVAGAGTSEATEFNIETVVSQRILNFGDRTIKYAATSSSGGELPSGGYGYTDTEPANPTSSVIPGSSIIPPGSSVDYYVAGGHCPWLNLLPAPGLPSGSILVNFMDGNPDDRFGLGLPNWPIVMSGPDQYSKVWRDFYMCTPWKNANILPDCNTGGERPWRPIIHFDVRSGSQFFNGYNTAVCPLATFNTSSGAQSSVGPGGIPINGNYDIYIATDDVHHCITPKNWNGSSPCTAWDPQDQNERAAAIIRDTSGTTLVTTSFTNDLPVNKTANVTQVGANVHFNNEHIGNVDIFVQDYNTWSADHKRNYNLQHDINNSCSPSETAYASPFPSFPPENQALVSLGVGCMLLVPTGSTYPSGADHCPSGQDRCSPPNSNKCKPVGATCCNANHYCDAGKTCSVGGNTCEVSTAGCDPGDPNASQPCGAPGNMHCIPAGALCCASVGKPDVYCPNNTYTCSPDGQCFQGGSGASVSGTQTLDSEEF